MKDLIPLAEKIALELIARKQTIAVAESSTGGLISAALLAVPGASAYFLGGGVIYTRDARKILMDIPDEAMKGLRSASEPYAQLLAKQISEGPGFANTMTKRMLAMEWAMSVEEAIEAEAVAQALCMTTEDFARAFHAFANKAKPKFEGN